MGRAIAALAKDAGQDVQVIDTDTDAAVTGDLVVLAVPYAALDPIVEHYGGQLAGRVVVDITNPVNFETFDSMMVPPDSSAAAQLAARLPSAKVLKAFNTNFAATLAAKSLGTQPTAVLVAGDDDAAKQQFADLFGAAGLAVVDAGGLARARELEALGFLQVTLAVAGKLSWTGGFAFVG